MKVLFALGNEQTSKKVAEKYYEKYGEEIEYKNVFYFKALLDEVRNDKTYDRIVVSEELEQFHVKSLEVLDKFLFTNIDNITDEIEDSEVIFICSDRRTKQNDRFVERLFNIGVYNTLIGDERRVEPLCDYLKKPMNKKEAKRHLNITSVVSEGEISTDDDNVEEVQIMHILKYYDGIRGNTEEYLKAFDRIAEQYSKNQLKVIINFLPLDVKSVVLASDRYAYLSEGLPEASVPKKGNKTNAKTSNNKTHKKGLFGILKENKNKDLKKPQPVVVVEEKKKESANEADARAMEEASEREQAMLKARAEQEAKEREQAMLKERAEQEAKEREQAMLKARAEQEAKEREQAMLKARAEQEAKEREQAMLKERAEQEAKEREQAMLKAKAEQEKNQKSQNFDVQIDVMPGVAFGEKESVTQEAFKMQQAELKAKAEQEAKEREQAELKAKAEQEAAIARQQAELKARAEQEAKEREQAELKAKAEQVAREREEAELKAKAEREAKEREQAELKVKAEQDALARQQVELEKKSEEQERIETERKKLEQEKLALEEERRRLREQSEQLTRNTEAIARTDFNSDMYSTPKIDYKKMVIFVGANKSGTTFMVNAVSHHLADNQVGVGVLDMTRDKSLYYIYNQDDKDLRQIASECMDKLIMGVDSYIPVEKNLKVYTTIPGAGGDARRILKNRPIIDTVRDNNMVVIVDADFTTPLEYYEKADEIYIIQDLDIMKMQETTLFLRELKSRSVDMGKIRIIINKYVKSLLTPKRLIQGLSYYNDPQMSFTDELLGSRVPNFIVPFDMENYSRYIDGMYKNSLDYKKYTSDFLSAIDEISKSVFKRSGAVTKKRGFFG